MIVTFLPQNIKQYAENGESLMDVAARANVIINGSCAGNGSCGKCKVQIMDSIIPLADSAERLILKNDDIENNFRLACHYKISKDVIVRTQSGSAASRKINLHFMPEDFQHTNHIKKTYIKVEQATLDNQHSDQERIVEALGDDKCKMNPKLFPKINKMLKDNQHRITAVLRGSEIIDIQGGDTTDRCFGIAFDTGTTTVVGMLWNMLAGELVGVSAVTNPQSLFGADVISRINYASENDAQLEIMQTKIINCFNEIIKGFEDSCQVEANEIYDMTIVGNTTMSHLIMGINPEQLAMAPFPPVFCSSIDMDALEMRLEINPLANVHILPNIAGHVGSDITAGIIATKLANKEGLQLFIDIGTNGEIVLAKDGRLLTCSTAAGPAFEGATIYQGMRAAAGAIEVVKILDSVVEFKTIEDVEPIGICGSGLIDAVGEMLKSRLMAPSGRLLDEEEALKLGVDSKLASRLRKRDKVKEFVLAYNNTCEDIVITQKDIREMQLAKAAIYAGISIMIKKMGETEEGLEGITIAGAFGNYINIESALRIGLLPPINKDIVVSAGNTAGIGASMALLSLKERDEAKILSRKMEHIELAAQPEFQEEYINATKF